MHVKFTLARTHNLKETTAYAHLENIVFQPSSVNAGASDQQPGRRPGRHDCVRAHRRELPPRLLAPLHPSCALLSWWRYHLPTAKSNCLFDPKLKFEAFFGYSADLEMCPHSPQNGYTIILQFP